MKNNGAVTFVSPLILDKSAGSQTVESFTEIIKVHRIMHHKLNSGQEKKYFQFTGTVYLQHG